MIKQLRHLCTLLLLAVASVAWGEVGDVAYTFATAQSTSNTAYATLYDLTIDGLDWSVPGNQNFNGFVRIGGKSLTNEDRIITGKSPISAAIGKITINHNGISNANLKVNKVTLTVASNEDFSNIVETIVLTPTFAAGTKGSFDFEPSSTGWPENSYYKFTFNFTNGYTTNYGLDVQEIVFYEGIAGVFVEKINPNLSFSLDEVTADINNSFTPPTLSNPENVNVSWASSAPNVATVDEDGNVTLLAVGTTKITASFDGDDDYNPSSASYTLTVVDPNAPGATAENPYTVAQARAAIDSGTGVTGVYAKGIVSEIIDSYSSQFKNISFCFVDEKGNEENLEAYRCKGEDAANVQIGDIVVVKGSLTKYNSIYEFASGCELVSLTHPAYPIIVAGDLTIEYNATSDTLDYTVNNPTEGVKLTATTTADWISNIIIEEGLVIFSTTVNDGEADRTATMTLSYEGADDVTVTLTQKHLVADYAKLPFEFDGGKENIDNVSGLTQEGLGTDYNSSPKLKFDNTGDYLVLHFDGVPGELTFDIKGNSFSGGTFKVQASKDGENYTDIETYTELGTTQSEEFNNLDADIRYIKWVYTEKVNGNVALGNIKLAKYEAPQMYKLAIANPENVTITANYGEELLQNGESGEITKGTEVTLALSIAEGYALDSLTVTGEEGQKVDVTQNATTAGVYTFTMPAYNVTVDAAVVEVETTTYVLATSINPGKRYIITNGSDKAMGQQNKNNRSAADVTIADGKATVISNTGVYEFVIDGDATNGYTIYDDSEQSTGYLYAASSSDNYLRTRAENDDNNGIWTIEIGENGVAKIIAQGNNTRNNLRYNSASKLFSCYEKGQDDVYLYEKELLTIPGDVTKDGEVTVADVEALVKILLGTATEEDNFDLEAAELDGVEGISIADLTKLVEMLLPEN